MTQHGRLAEMREAAKARLCEHPQDGCCPRQTLGALEQLGCGDGRLTVGIAVEAASVLAFDPDAKAVERARRFLPSELADGVAYQVASATQIELEPVSFDLALFSWSL